MCRGNNARVEGSKSSELGMLIRQFKAYIHAVCHVYRVIHQHRAVRACRTVGHVAARVHVHVQGQRDLEVLKLELSYLLEQRKTIQGGNDPLIQAAEMAFAAFQVFEEHSDKHSDDDDYIHR